MRREAAISARADALKAGRSMGKEYRPDRRHHEPTSRVIRVSPVTTTSHDQSSSPLNRNFQESVPLTSKELEFLDLSFALGDSDPRWSFGPGAESALRLQRSLETIANAWGLPPSTLTFFADRYLAFYLAINGVLIANDFPSISLSTIEKKEVLAIIDGLPDSLSRHHYSVGIDGIFDSFGDDQSLHIFQIRNGETGISQRRLPDGALIIDATSALPGDLSEFDLASLPWHAIILDATSWGGPRGLYALSINPAFHWRNPMPTLDTSMPTFGANYGLTILAALQLDEFLGRDHRAIIDANERVREIVSQIADVDIAGSDTRDRLSLSFLYTESEELQRSLYAKGFLFDSGSACSSSQLEPSHVLTRMGLLSHGNVRLRFRPENLASVEEFAHALIEAVGVERSRR